MDVITPLKISLLSNIVNCVLDPILIFKAGMGVAGAAAATCVAEIISFLLFIKALINKKMVTENISS
jgi:Na+-driven multidrug efflux pump